MSLKIHKRVKDDHGGNATVYEAICQQKKCALKVWFSDNINIDETEIDGEGLCELVYDIDVLFGLKSKYTVEGYKFYGGNDLPELDVYAAVSEELMDGNLVGLFKRFSFERIFKEQILIKMINNVWNAMNDLFKMGYYHLDIRPPNIFYKLKNQTLETIDDIDFYLGDYGTCRRINNFIPIKLSTLHSSPFDLHFENKEDYLKILLFSLATSCLFVMGKWGDLKKVYYSENDKFYLTPEAEQILLESLHNNTLAKIIFQMMGIKDDDSIGIPEIPSELKLDDSSRMTDDCFHPEIDSVKMTKIIEMILSHSDKQTCEEIFLAIEFYLRLYNKVDETPNKIAIFCLNLSSLNRTRNFNDKKDDDFMILCLKELKGKLCKNPVYDYFIKRHFSIPETLIDGELYLTIRKLIVY